MGPEGVVSEAGHARLFALGTGGPRGGSCTTGRVERRTPRQGSSSPVREHVPTKSGREAALLKLEGGSAPRLNPKASAVLAEMVRSYLASKATSEAEKS